MAQQLRRTGCSVSVADNGEEALKYLSTTSLQTDMYNAPDLSVILMDVEMPVMDGLTCSRKIRAMEASGRIKKHIPIAAITANSRQEQIDTARAAGMDDVITKPFRIAEIIPRIEVLATKFAGSN
jgi:CheY-like chemotaxis protein